LLLTPLAIPAISGLTLVTTIIGLLILWIIVSIPVYFAAKLLVGSRAHFGSAMLATLVGPIIFAIVLGIGYYLAARIFAGLDLLALLIAFLAWIWVYKAAFHTGWLHAFGIAILAIIIAIVILALLALLGFAFHAFTHVFSLELLMTQIRPRIIAF
jgi:hypothetical protein